MRRLNKSYPYQKPCKNRSSKHLNLIIGPASVSPNYLGWSIEQLQKASARCKNKISNVFEDTLKMKLRERELKAKRRAAKQQNSTTSEAK